MNENPMPTGQAVTPAAKATEPARPAAIPRGFWRSVDYILRHPEEILESLRTDTDLWRMSRIFFLVSLVMAALYGAVMGATNLLQNSEMEMAGKLWMILVTGLKVPILFLVTLAIVLPPVYVSNAFMGSRLSFRQMATALLSSLAVTTTVLASMATVAFFFAITSRSYNFLKLLHVAVFAYAGLAGLQYLVKSMQIMMKGSKRETSTFLFLMWLALYMFVGTQLAWVLRPFVGSPNLPFRIFRARSGNFYESVAESIRSLPSTDNETEGKW